MVRQECDNSATWGGQWESSNRCLGYCTWSPAAQSLVPAQAPHVKLDALQKSNVSGGHGEGLLILGVSRCCA